MTPKELYEYVKQREESYKTIMNDAIEAGNEEDEYENGEIYDIYKSIRVKLEKVKQYINAIEDFNNIQIWGD